MGLEADAEAEVMLSETLAPRGGPLEPMRAADVCWGQHQMQLITAPIRTPRSSPESAASLKAIVQTVCSGGGLEM